MKPKRKARRFEETSPWMNSRGLLIAEDDKALRQMLRWEFEELGYRVITAASCREALSALADHQIDLALLDYNLPDGVGTDLLRALHRMAWSLPVVVYSGRVSPKKIEEAEKCGAFCFVAKPVASAALHAIFLQLPPHVRMTPASPAANRKC